MTGTATKVSDGNLAEFNHFFKWNRILLNIMGIWPQRTEVQSKFGSFGAAFLTFLMAIVVATQWADLVVIWGQLDPMVDNLSATVGISSSIVKLIIIRMNFKTFQQCFDQVQDDWCTGNTNAHLQVMLRRARVGRIFSMASPAFSIAVALLYSILPLTLKNSNQSTEIFAPFPLRAAYFFDPTPTPIYEMIYLAQSIACYTSSISQSAIDSFFAALVLHACAQLEILGQKLRAADKKRPMIRNLVERHLQLIEFVENLENVYSTMIFGQLLVGSLTISGIGYRLIMSLDDGNLTEMAKFVFYLAAGLIGIFIYCYAGQCLIDESTRLSEAAYSCDWYDMDRSDAKAFLLIQSQAQLPLQITALNFCVMSHECFSEIVRRSVTYLSVLRALKSSI